MAKMIEIELPDSIKIGGFDYSILMNKEVTRELMNLNRYGDSSDFVKRIRIDETDNSQTISNTFMHELLHQVDSVYCNHRLDENEIATLANGLHQVFEQLGIRFVKKVYNAVR